MRIAQALYDLMDLRKDIADAREQLRVEGGQTATLTFRKDDRRKLKDYLRSLDVAIEELDGFLAGCGAALDEGEAC